VERTSACSQLITRILVGLKSVESAGLGFMRTIEWLKVLGAQIEAQLPLATHAQDVVFNLINGLSHTTGTKKRKFDRSKRKPCKRSSD